MSMTPKPTLSIEDLKNKALAAQMADPDCWFKASDFKGTYIDGKDAELIEECSPDVVLGLIARVEDRSAALNKMADVLKRIQRRSVNCRSEEMRLAGYICAAVCDAFDSTEVKKVLDNPQPPRTLDKGD